jgi:hypothetical protein
VKSANCEGTHYVVPSSPQLLLHKFPSPNTLFSNTLRLCSSPRATDRVSHPYEVKAKLTLSCVLKLRYWAWHGKTEVCELMTGVRASALSSLTQSALNWLRAVERLCFCGGLWFTELKTLPLYIARWNFTLSFIHTHPQPLLYVFGQTNQGFAVLPRRGELLHTSGRHLVSVRSGKYSEDPVRNGPRMSRAVYVSTVRSKGGKRASAMR